VVAARLIVTPASGQRVRSLPLSRSGFPCDAGAIAATARSRRATKKRSVVFAAWSRRLPR
jgi:hypothetical protein